MVYTCTWQLVKYYPWIFISGATSPGDVHAVQAGPTSIRVTWTLSSNATGYRINYANSGGLSEHVTASSSTIEHTLTGLQNGDTYTISIVATSDTGFPSASVVAMDVGLGMHIQKDKAPITLVLF